MNGMRAHLTNFFKPPEYQSIERTQKARFLHTTLLVVTGACLITGALNLGDRPYLGAFLFLVGGISFACIPLNRRGYYMPVALLISFLVLAVITFSLLGVGLADAGLMPYPLFIVFTSYLLNKKASFWAVAASIGSVVLVYYLDQMGMVAHVAYSNENRLTVICVLLMSAGLFVWAITDNWEQIVQNLKDTYDSTLAGWGRALEYRDQGTFGHSQRVVEMTVALARQCGIAESEIDHIRHGALLHDIGKMAIPDAILLKDGRLTDDEHRVMQMHPIYARNLLEQIQYLKPALDIPYSHHERWDGTGYPEGLSGKDIPIAARIFTVVDVWDALTTDRPYHQASTREEARDYIQNQSGKMFDPQIVEVFMKFLDSGSHPSSKSAEGPGWSAN